MNESLDAERKTVLTTNTGRGKELCDLLMAELGVPERTQRFTVTFAVGEAVRVLCEYTPLQTKQG